MFEVYLSKEAEKTYLKADHKKTKLLDNCFEHLEKSPLFGPNIKRLKGPLEGNFRYRTGGTRVIYTVDLETKKVYIETIGSRGDVYK